jgi:hypothetical protein
VVACWQHHRFDMGVVKMARRPRGGRRHYTRALSPGAVGNRTPASCQTVRLPAAAIDTSQASHRFLEIRGTLPDVARSLPMESAGDVH